MKWSELFENNEFFQEIGTGFALRSVEQKCINLDYDEFLKISQILKPGNWVCKRATMVDNLRDQEEQFWMMNADRPGQRLTIIRLEDDYYFVKALRTNQRFSPCYKCDQIDGLQKLFSYLGA